MRFDEIAFLLQHCTSKIVEFNLEIPNGLMLSVLEDFLKVRELLDHFAPQPVIGPILPNPAPAA